MNDALKLSLVNDDTPSYPSILLVNQHPIKKYELAYNFTKMIRKMKHIFNYPFYYDFFVFMKDKKTFDRYVNDKTNQVGITRNKKAREVVNYCLEKKYRLIPAIKLVDEITNNKNNKNINKHIMGNCIELLKLVCLFVEYQ